MEIRRISSGVSVNAALELTGFDRFASAVALFYWHVRAAGFHRAKKCDQHLGLSMTQHGNRSAIVAEALCQVKCKPVRESAQLGDRSEFCAPLRCAMASGVAAAQ